MVIFYQRIIILVFLYLDNGQKFAFVALKSVLCWKCERGGGVKGLQKEVTPQPMCHTPVHVPLLVLMSFL